MSDQLQGSDFQQAAVAQAMTDPAGWFDALDPAVARNLVELEAAFTMLRVDLKAFEMLLDLVPEGSEAAAVIHDRGRALEKFLKYVKSYGENQWERLVTMENPERAAEYRRNFELILAGEYGDDLAAD
jgi:hypothetical protein